MKIAIAGGIGFEKEVLEILVNNQVLLVGSSYDLKREKFQRFSNVEFIGEFFTRSYEVFFADYDIFIDISESLKSKFILNDMSVKFQKKYISLFYDKSWKLGVFNPRLSCLECLLEFKRTGPSFLIPEAPQQEVLAKIREAVIEKNGGSYCIDLSDGEIVKIPFLESCKVSAGELRFLRGEMDDVVAVSCSDVSVAVTPMEEMKLDLDYYRKVLSAETKIIGQNSFYLEFKIHHLNVLLFRHGRIIVKGTKEKNTAMAVYRRYIGN